MFFEPMRLFFRSLTLDSAPQLPLAFLLSRSLTRVFDHGFNALLAFHFTAPVKFTLALRHLREVVGVMSAFTTQVRTTAGTLRGFLAYTILRSRDS